jgi:chemotaxis protein methyltransferase CheR
VKLSDELFQQARSLIANRLGLDFPESRKADLDRALLRVIQSSSAWTLDTYWAWLATVSDEHPEWKRLASHLTVGETYFFRDPCCFEALEQHVLVPLIASRRAERNLRLRLWSAACASGEEPYSLAILLARLLPDRADWAVTILGTDVNPEALKVAHGGIYRQWSFREATCIGEQYFRRHGADSFEIDPGIKAMVTLVPLNLAENDYPDMITNTAAMDVILCRNVLMYFTPEAQRATVSRLQRALVSGGWLVVSPAEASAELLYPLVGHNFRGAILHRKEEESTISRRPAAIKESRFALTPPRSEAVVETPCPAVLPREESHAQAVGQTRLIRARSFADKGKLEEAQQQCQAAIDADRLDGEAHLLLAAIYQEQGEIERALESLRRALYLLGDSAPGHFLRGSLLIRQGKRSLGLRHMQTVVNLLGPVLPEVPVVGSDGLTAGRLLKMAEMFLAAKG